MKVPGIELYISYKMFSPRYARLNDEQYIVDIVVFSLLVC